MDNEEIEIENNSFSYKNHYMIIKIDIFLLKTLKFIYM